MLKIAQLQPPLGFGGNGLFAKLLIPARLHYFGSGLASPNTWLERRGLRLGFRGFPFGQPPSFAFAREEAAFLSLLIEPSIAAGLISFPQCGQFMVCDTTSRV